MWAGCGSFLALVPAARMAPPVFLAGEFWDTEIYVLPLLIYQEPRIARNLLKFRYDGPGKAREVRRTSAQKHAASHRVSSRPRTHWLAFCQTGKG